MQPEMERKFRDSTTKAFAFFKNLPVPVQVALGVGSIVAFPAAPALMGILGIIETEAAVATLWATVWGWMVVRFAEKNTQHLTPEAQIALAEYQNYSRHADLALIRFMERFGENKGLKPGMAGNRSR